MQFISKLYEFLIQSYDYAKMTFKTGQSRREPGLKSPVEGGNPWTTEVVHCAASTVQKCMVSEIIAEIMLLSCCH